MSDFLGVLKGVSEESFQKADPQDLEQVNGNLDSISDKLGQVFPTNQLAVDLAQVIKNIETQDKQLQNELKGLSQEQFEN